MEAILEERKSRKTENTLNNTGTYNAKNIYQMFANIVRVLSIILTSKDCLRRKSKFNPSLCKKLIVGVQFQRTDLMRRW